MDVGLVGLPSCGKTTLFNALTGQQAAGFGDKPHVGMANIPDPRLEKIAQFIPPEKIIPATIRLVDIPGVPPGSDAKKISGFLEHVRQVDTVCQVVRCFDDGMGIDVPGDIDKMETELILADLVVAEGAQNKAARTARTGDKDAKERVAVLESVSVLLDEGTPIRLKGDWSESEQKILRSYGFISAKPVLYVANVAEDDLDGKSEHAAAVRDHAQASGGQSVSVCTKLESELSELDPADRLEMLESMGLSEPAIGPLARAAMILLGLSNFYTAGEKEVRSWAIHAGASAREAAGAIHSDIERGFIRAECYGLDDLIQYKTEKAIRDAGKLRSEGKNYTMQDGDIVHFLFNV
ncbi:MAG: redox-regulated ATPase YchF [Planctomycetota bacterium]|nr:redox-regulated ATPase YchF [Planctomycetota bacterium]